MDIFDKLSLYMEYYIKVNNNCIYIKSCLVNREHFKRMGLFCGDVWAIVPYEPYIQSFEDFINIDKCVMKNYCGANWQERGFAS